MHRAYYGIVVIETNAVDICISLSYFHIIHWHWGNHCKYMDKIATKTPYSSNLSRQQWAVAG